MEISVREYATENPNMDFNALLMRFGTPRQIAESCVGDMEMTDLLKEMKARGKLLHMALAAAMLLVLIWFGFTATAYYHHEKSMDGYAVVDVIEVERTSVAEGGN